MKYRVIVDETSERIPNTFKVEQMQVVGPIYKQAHGLIQIPRLDSLIGQAVIGEPLHFRALPLGVCADAQNDE
jgi:hypothetical protein